MKNTLKVSFLTAFVFVLSSGMAFAQESAKTGSSAWAIFLGAALAIGIAGSGCGVGMGRAIGSALEGVSRNPDVAPRIMTMMLLGLALIESLAIYALVVSMLLLFVI